MHDRLARLLAAGALVVVAAGCWWALAETASLMTSMRGEGLLMTLMMLMMSPAAAGPYLAAAGVMWIAMMIAMMTPAILPTLLVFARLEGRQRAGTAQLAAFAAGYLVLWSGFGLLAAGLQWWLHGANALHTAALATSPRAAGTILIAAGLYQFTPFKSACLSHCQSPLGFLLGHWRDGTAGAFRMGLAHGRYCLGCCAALMAVMFAGGVMSLGTMAAVSAIILLERLLPSGRVASWGPGLALLGWGVALVV
ncbi:MAG: DUF2182 domain-containing protein [Gammaproteobacteria bacterium]|nr:DUF2182 domain-containing protein [Gammaproteobacteria bacterium]